MFGRNFVYVQDNALPHTARDTVAFLEQQDVEVMDWPARSPDMNPIEHVLDVSLDRRHGPPTPHPNPNPTPPPSSARKGADPGRKHASSCQGSSGR